MENLSLQDIKCFRKSSFEMIIKDKVRDKVFEKLTIIMKIHFKVTSI